MFGQRTTLAGLDGLAHDKPVEESHPDREVLDGESRDTLLPLLV